MSRRIITTVKKSIVRLVDICYQRGLRRVIFSPGSRNAPLVIAFTAHGGYDCQTVADERVAAFIALGHGIATHQPTIICCTSGSAVLNYAPAIAEAYYQRVPLLILTADRPSEWIDQGIGQSMRQKEVYKNYIKFSSPWIENAKSEEDLLHNDEVINKSISITTTQPYGPVHINIPFYEPLYETISHTEHSPPLIVDLSVHPSNYELDKDLIRIWNNSKRKIILVGQLHPDKTLGERLSALVKRKDVILVTETTSNIKGDLTIGCIDRALNGVGRSRSLLQPDLLISIGGAIISKLIKKFFRENKPSRHWYLDEGQLKDTYRANPSHLKAQPLTVLTQLIQLPSKNNTAFQKCWNNLREQTSRAHNEFVKELPYSDLKVMAEIFSNCPPKCNLHLANSTPVRYAQLFEQKETINYYSNRGVSGIDGSTSTAIGFSQLDSKHNILVTGDMSFLYDSNAFWITEYPANLSIILINNGGGGIFRYIPGPDTTDQLESVFEAHHKLDASHISKMYGLSYRSINNIDDFKLKFGELVGQKFTKMLLEVFTPRENNAKILRQYFSYIKSQAI